MKWIWMDQQSGNCDEVVYGWAGVRCSYTAKQNADLGSNVRPASKPQHVVYQEQYYERSVT